MLLGLAAGQRHGRAAQDANQRGLNGLTAPVQAAATGPAGSQNGCPLRRAHRIRDLALRLCGASGLAASRRTARQPNGAGSWDHRRPAPL